MIENKKVGQAITHFRREKNMTQQDLAAYLEVSHQAVSKWENGAALPDILTLVKLARLFGVTLEQLLNGETGAEQEAEPEIRLHLDPVTPEATDDGAAEPEQAEANAETAEAPDLNKIISMAPFMSREALESIVTQYNGKCTPRQLASLAPFVSSECLESLIVNCESEITWDSLRRLAPFLKKEAVDSLTIAVAKGEKYMRSTFDAMRKTYDEVDKSITRVIKKLTNPAEEKPAQPENAPSAEAQGIVDRAAIARARIFERALSEEKFDWIAAHLEQLDDDDLKSRIADRARALNMTDWLEANMPAYQDAEALNEALLDGDWDRVAERLTGADEGELAMVAQTALTENRWDWISEHMADLSLSDEACVAIANAALAAEKLDFLSAYPEELDLNAAEMSRATQIALSSGRWDWISARMDDLLLSDEARTAVVGAALEEGRLDFLDGHLDELDLNSEELSALADYIRENGEWAWLQAHLDEIYPEEYDGFALAKDAYLAGQKDLARQVVEDYATDAAGALMEFALAQDDTDFAETVLETMRTSDAGEACVKAARNGHLSQVVPLAEHLNRNAVSELLEIATENGDWAIIEQLYEYLD